MDEDIARLVALFGTAGLAGFVRGYARKPFHERAPEDHGFRRLEAPIVISALLSGDYVIPRLMELSQKPGLFEAVGEATVATYCPYVLGNIAGELTRAVVHAVSK